MARRPISFPHLTLDLDQLVVRRGGEELVLTAHEAGLLGYLADRPGEVVSRDTLLTEVWGYKAGLQTRAVDNTVVRLRGKLELDPREPQILRTVYGHGYRLDLPQSALAPRPELRTLPLTGNTNLVRATDSFLGRADDLAALRALLGQGGVVCVLGPGGVGKTRLVRELGLELAPRLSGGVWFVDLSEVTAASAFPEAVARALCGSAPAGAGDPAEVQAQVAHALRGRGPVLLVLDNLEQLLPAVVPTLAAWRDAAPEARLLLTSRTASGLAGEAVLGLGPLGTEAALALYGSRARRVRPGFALGPSNQPAVTELVARLDHLPLAIELAASWADVLPPDRVLQRLLTSSQLSARTVREGRHRSLDAAMGWSWEMLAPPMAQALARASVFRGGFDLEAAEAVLGHEALTLLEALRDRSWVRYGHLPERPDQPRFSLLVSVADFLGRKLVERGEAAATGMAHAAWYLPLAERLAAEGGPEAAFQLGAELENVLAAHRNMRGVRPDLSARAALAADRVLAVRGPPTLRLAVLDEATRQAAGDAALGVRARVARASALQAMGRTDEAAVDLQAAQADDEEGRALVTLGEAELLHGRGLLREALARVAQAALTFRAGGDLRGEANAERLRAVLLQELHDLDASEAAGAVALRLYQRAGDVLGAAAMTGSLGNTALMRGRTAEARARYAEALELHRAAGNRWGEATVLGNLATALFEEGLLAKADLVYADAIAGHRAVGNRRFEAMCLSNAGVLAWRRGDAETARRHLGQAVLAHAQCRNARSHAYALFNLAVLDHEDGLQEAAGARLEELAALAAPVGDPRLNEAVAVWRALVRAQAGHLDEARRLLAGVPAEQPDRALLEAALAARGGAVEAWEALRGRATASVQTQALIRALQRWASVQQP